MITAEVVVVVALVGVSWHLLATPSGPDGPQLLIPSSSPPSDVAASIPADDLAPPQTSARPLLPGLNIDPAFWRQRLLALNEAEAQFEALEWRLVHSAMDSMQRYLETVVLPSVKRAESGGPRV
jgi:hypothetical protein